MSTVVWFSAAVVNVSFFLVGMVVFREMRVVITEPKVSSPSVKGVTSRSTISSTSPAKMPAWMAAPMATASSGLTFLFGSLPKTCLTFSWTAGMRLMPPTMITSSMALAFNPESVNAWRQGPSVRSTKSETNCSSLARLSVLTICCGPLASAVMKGRLISVSRTLDRSTLARSAASRSRCKAMRSVVRSMPVSCLNSSIIHSSMSWSKSSPPKNVSPLVDLTSNTPSPIWRIVMSNVPPPRSNTAMVASVLVLSSP